MDRVFGEYVYADNLQDTAHALLDSQGLIENGNHQVDADSDPDLRLHGILAEPEERLHAKVLLDPFEEELDLPARFVDLRDDQRIDFEVVGYEDQKLPRLRVPKAHPPQVVGKELPGLRSVEANSLVGSQSDHLVHGARLPNVVAHVGLRSRHEERPSRMDTRQSKEIDVSTIQYVEGSGFEDDPVQGVDVLNLSLRDRYERWDRAVQVDHGVKLDRGLPLAKASPGKKAHAQVYCGGVDCIDNLVYVQNVSIHAVQLSSLADEDLGKLEIDLPVPMLVGVGKVGSCRRSANTHRVEQVRLGPETSFYVAKAFPVGELRKNHAKKLVPRCQALARSRHRVLGYAPIELLPMTHIGYWRENETASIHTRQSQQDQKPRETNSNASQP